MPQCIIILSAHCMREASTHIVTAKTPPLRLMLSTATVALPLQTCLHSMASVTASSDGLHGLRSYTHSVKHVDRLHGIADVRLHVCSLLPQLHEFLCALPVRNPNGGDPVQYESFCKWVAVWSFGTTALYSTLTRHG
jgi:hypothetical protein